MSRICVVRPCPWLSPPGWVPGSPKSWPQRKQSSLAGSSSIGIELLSLRSRKSKRRCTEMWPSTAPRIYRCSYSSQCNGFFLQCKGALQKKCRISREADSMQTLFSPPKPGYAVCWHFQFKIAQIGKWWWLWDRQHIWLKNVFFWKEDLWSTSWSWMARKKNNPH